MTRSYPMLQLAFFVLLSCPLLSLSSSTGRMLLGRGKGRGQGGVSFCLKTTYPTICKSATGSFGAPGRGGLSAEAVLKMHLGAIAHRSESASRTATRLMRRAKPSARAALKHCAALHQGKWDIVGESLRELRTKDPQTKQMIRIMLQLLKQSAQECDLMFQQSRLANPLLHFNRSIYKLAVNCDDLNNMMK